NEPVVTDNITGLMWQGCPVGLSGNGCTGLGASNGPWMNALQSCNALTWGGYKDWRLPDLYELESIVDLGTSSPAIDIKAFPATPANPFWTSSSSAGGGSSAWCVEFGAGGAEPSPSGNAYYGRCVRSSPSPSGPATRFSLTVPVLDQPVVTDNRTGLVWQGCAAGLTE